MDQILNLIPFIQKYPPYVKYWAAATLLCLVITIILVLLSKPEAPSDSPTTVSTPSSSTNNEKKVETHHTTDKQPTKHAPKDQEPKILQKNKSGNNQVNQNIGNNSGNIGGSHNTINNNYGGVVNNYGLTVRKVEKDFMDDFEHYFPNKNIHIRFMAFGGVDSEIDNVRVQIITELRIRGYNDIDETFNLKYGEQPPPQIVFGQNTLGGATFFIPPNK